MANDGPKSVPEVLGTIVAGILFWTVVIGGSYVGCTYVNEWLDHESASSSDDGPVRHDDLWRRSQGSDRTNWVPGNVGR